jgi:hypothetical protein
MDLLVDHIINHIENPSNYIYQVFEFTTTDSTTDSTTKKNQIKVSRFSSKKHAMVYIIDSALTKAAHIIDLEDPTADNMLEVIHDDTLFNIYDIANSLLQLNDYCSWPDYDPNLDIEITTNCRMKVSIDSIMVISTKNTHYFHYHSENIEILNYTDLKLPKYFSLNSIELY